MKGDADASGSLLKFTEPETFLIVTLIKKKRPHECVLGYKRVT